MINKQPKSVTIIIRSKNESKWISSCLKSVKSQNYEKNKVQIILLDNNSTDKTKNIAKKYHVKIVDYKPRKYFPGAALNKAVKIAKNEIMVFLSAHCIPTNNNWLRNLINSFDILKLPYMVNNILTFSSFVDKRDLYNHLVLKEEFKKKIIFFIMLIAQSKKNY